MPLMANMPIVFQSFLKIKNKLITNGKKKKDCLHKAPRKRNSALSIKDQPFFEKLTRKYNPRVLKNMPSMVFHGIGG